MRRRLLTLLIFLLAGVVVNAAVAWGCAAHADSVELLGIGIDADLEALWQRYAKDDWPEQRSGAYVGYDVGYMTRTCNAVIRGDGVLSDRGYHVWQVRAGWPMLMLLSEQWSDDSGWGVAYGLGLLPHHAIWRGFTINTLFYAAILWLLICGPFALRRFLRSRRGLCPKCTYPVGEAPVCSECGRALPKRASPAT